MSFKITIEVEITDDMIKDEGDAETADVFLQCCLFNELVYG